MRRMGKVMSDEKDKSSLETRALAEKLLLETFGGKVQLGESEDLSTKTNRSKVYRLQVADGPGTAPTSVIVKQAISTESQPYDPEMAKVPAVTLFNDWASSQFLSELMGDAPSFGPRFYAGDRELGLFIMEDLGSGQRLDQFLLGDDPVAAEKALLSYATTHGKLHALTRGKQTEFERIRTRLGPIPSFDEFLEFNELITPLNRTLEILSLKPRPGIEAELTRIIQSWKEPGPFLTFSQGDACPDNCLWVGDGLKLLDFEGAAYTTAFRDGVYGRIHFPSCWCVFRIPEPLLLQMEATYRAELVKGCPEAAQDELYYPAVVEACGFWVFTNLPSLYELNLLEEDPPTRASSIRQRLMLRFDIFAKATEEFGHLEALGATLKDIRAKLRTIWPSEAEEMAPGLAVHNTSA